jgi:hypothetical protein
VTYFKHMLHGSGEYHQNPLSSTLPLFKNGTRITKQECNCPIGYCVTCISVRCVFLCDDNDICSLWGFYAAMYGSSVPTFRDNISGLSARPKHSKKNGFLPREDGSDGLFRDFGTELPHVAV